MLYVIYTYLYSTFIPMDIIEVFLVFSQEVGHGSNVFMLIDTTRKNNFGQVNWYPNKWNRMGIWL